MRKLIDFFKLTDWYTSTFSADERSMMESKAVFENPAANGSAGLWLAMLSASFNTKASYDICRRIVEKAENIFNDSDAEDSHFFYLQMIKFYYKNRDKHGYLEKAIGYCNKQIAIAPRAAKALLANPLLGAYGLPVHTGFEQLAIIEKKNKNWPRVIELCEQAKAQGWSGDWDKRIAEAKSKL